MCYIDLFFFSTDIISELNEQVQVLEALNSRLAYYEVSALRNLPSGSRITQSHSGHQIGSSSAAREEQFTFRDDAHSSRMSRQRSRQDALHRNTSAVPSSSQLFIRTQRSSDSSPEYVLGDDPLRPANISAFRKSRQITRHRYNSVCNVSNLRRHFSPSIIPAARQLLDSESTEESQPGSSATRNDDTSGSSNTRVVRSHCSSVSITDVEESSSSEIRGNFTRDNSPDYLSDSSDLYNESDSDSYDDSDDEVERPVSPALYAFEDGEIPFSPAVFRNAGRASLIIDGNSRIGILFYFLVLHNILIIHKYQKKHNSS